MTESGFDPDDIVALRRLKAGAAQETMAKSDTAPQTAIVQLNVRVSAQIKQAVQDLARENGWTTAEVIELAVQELRAALEAEES
jgi:hypothetical protein